MDMTRYEQDIVDAVKRLVDIPSVLDEDRDEAPFSDAIDRCLDETLALCASLGMRTFKQSQGYYGFAEIGIGEDYIGILCHLDVVPTGDLSKWNTPPFDATVKDGVIYGRGTGDDKGPTVAAIYAVKALLDEQVKLTKRIRLIFGTDEETLWRGIAVYKQDQKPPLFAFAADGYFPFTYAEKGLLQLDLIRLRANEDIVFHGGKNYNSVAANAVYQGPLATTLAGLASTAEIDVKSDDDRIEIIGVPSHASAPMIGKNAVLYLADLMRQAGVEQPHVRLLSEVFRYDYAKTALFDEPITDHTGDITVNIGAIEMNDNILIKLDMRMPVSYAKDDIIAKVENKVKPYGFDVVEHSFLEPLYVPLDSPFTNILLDTYRGITGDMESQPRINGGATYARAYPDRTVCFGVKRKGRPSFAHEPNEQIDIDVLVNGAYIYFETLKKLNDI